MDARLHYSRRLLLQIQLQGPAACPSPSAAVPDARRVVPAAASSGELGSDAILTLALLTCGLVAAFAFRVVLQCALRVTRGGGTCCGGGADDNDDDPEEQEQEPEEDEHAAGAQLQAAAARHGHGGKRLPGLVQALPPCLAFSAGLELELAGSECAICLAEFARGEAVRVLPRCRHGFHARCIDRWLAARATCPTCRQPPFAEPTETELL